MGLSKKQTGILLQGIGNAAQTYGLNRKKEQDKQDTEALRLGIINQQQGFEKSMQEDRQTFEQSHYDAAQAAADKRAQDAQDAQDTRYEMQQGMADIRDKNANAKAEQARQQSPEFRLYNIATGRIKASTPQEQDIADAYWGKKTKTTGTDKQLPTFQEYLAFHNERVKASANSRDGSGGPTPEESGQEFLKAYQAYQKLNGIDPAAADTALAGGGSADESAAALAAKEPPRVVPPPATGHAGVDAYNIHKLNLYDPYAEFRDWKSPDTARTPTLDPAAAGDVMGAAPNQNTPGTTTQQSPGIGGVTIDQETLNLASRHPEWTGLDPTKKQMLLMALKLDPEVRKLYQKQVDSLSNAKR